jgi:predicted nicotinamide N-methyase
VRIIFIKMIQIMLLCALIVLTLLGIGESFSVAHPKKIITLPEMGGKGKSIKRQKRKLEGKIPVISREIPINADDEIETITIWELEKPSKLMEMWWSSDLDPSAAVKKEQIGDPFGCVMWPGSILASKELANHRDAVQNSTVLVLGAGTGVEVQCAALLGASKVIAMDISKLTLKLLRFGAEQAGVGGVVEPVLFDLFSQDELPECDILVAADVLYNKELAQQIGKRVVEVLSRDSPPSLLITDSQRFHGTDFLQDVNDIVSDQAPLEWKYFELQNIWASGVMIDGDQTYDATTRMVSTGWPARSDLEVD